MLTIDKAAERAELSPARIRRLIAEGVLTAQQQPLLGTRLVRTVLDPTTFEEWLSTRASNRRRKYIIEVSDADFIEIADLLAAKGIGIKRKNIVPSRRRVEPFADLLLPDENEALRLDDLAEEPPPMSDLWISGEE